MAQIGFAAEPSAPPINYGSNNINAAPNYDFNQQGPEIDEKATEWYPPMQISGYEQVMSQGAVPPPPSYFEVMKQEVPHRDAIVNLPSLNEEECRSALLKLADSKCCWGTRAARNMNIGDISHSSVFRFVLESFRESRSTAWQHEPYLGQMIDGPSNGPAPGPWQIPATPLEPFKDSMALIEVPHTASVQMCHKCHGSGQVRCTWCFGSGRVSRTRIHRDNEGHSHTEYYHETCWHCHGRGRVACETCKGQGQLKTFVQLTIEWINHQEDFIDKTTEVSDKDLRKAQGKEVLSETAVRVMPIGHFPLPSINEASQRLLASHASKWPTDAILLQRQTVTALPVAQCVYEWNGDKRNFYVYGYEHQVFAPQYPHRCCCCCGIL